MHSHEDKQLNSDSCIWGVELDSNYGPKEVRDAVIVCFVQANGDMVLRMSGATVPTNEKEKEALTKELVEDLIRKTFEKSGEDFENPTKESILKVLEHLKEIARKVHQDESAIGSHYAEIKKLVDGLK